MSAFKFTEPVNKIVGVGLGQTAVVEFPPRKRIATAMLELTVTKAALGAGQFSIPLFTDGIAQMILKVGGRIQRTRQSAHVWGLTGLNSLMDATTEAPGGTVVYTQAGNAALSVVPVVIGSAADTAQKALLVANTITVAKFQLPYVFLEVFRKEYAYGEAMCLATGYSDGTSAGLATLELSIPANANITAVQLACAYEYDNQVAQAGTPIKLSKEYLHNVQYGAAGDIEVATQLPNRDVLQRVSLLTTSDRITNVVVKQGSQILRQISDVRNQAFLQAKGFNTNAIVSNRFDIELDWNDDPTAAPILDPALPISIVATLASAADATKNIAVLSSYFGALD